MISKNDKSTNEITQFTYDAENKLIELTKPGLTGTYKYNGLSRRIEKNVNGLITKYIYDRDSILLEYDGNN